MLKGLQVIRSNGIYCMEARDGGPTQLIPPENLEAISALISEFAFSAGWTACSVSSCETNAARSLGISAEIPAGLQHKHTTNPP